jgi:virulence factor Mce-like protein
VSRTTLRRLGATIAAAAVLVAGGLTWRAVASGERTTVEAMFVSTIGLYPGSDVAVLGVPVGTVTAVEPEGDSVRVSMELDAGQKVAADTKAVIVSPTLVSDRYVQLTEPYRGGEPLADGAVIDREDTGVPVEIDELYASLDDIATRLGPKGANKDGSLSRLLEVAAKNLDGNGEEINTLVTELGKATQTLSESDEDFFATVANLASFNDMLVDNDREIANVNRSLASVADYLADDRDELAEAVKTLGVALGDVEGFIGDNREALRTSVDGLTGPVAALSRQSRSLAEAIRTAPVVVQNFLRSYDPATGTMDGRANLNELTIWSKGGQVGKSSADAPPVLIEGER